MGKDMDGVIGRTTYAVALASLAFGLLSLRSGPRVTLVATAVIFGWSQIGGI